MGPEEAPTAVQLPRLCQTGVRLLRVHVGKTALSYVPRIVPWWSDNYQQSRAQGIRSYLHVVFIAIGRNIYLIPCVSVFFLKVIERKS